MRPQRSMDKTPCHYCQRVGLVRFEVVVKGKDASLTFYCGYWTRRSESDPVAGRKVIHPEA
jgi:hypothetical protein